MLDEQTIFDMKVVVSKAVPRDALILHTRVVEAGQERYEFVVERNIEEASNE